MASRLHTSRDSRNNRERVGVDDRDGVARVVGNEHPSADGLHGHANRVVPDRNRRDDLIVVVDHGDRVV